MRALSAIGFVISVIGLLLVCYNQFALIPALRNLYDADTRSYEFSIVLTHALESKHNLVSILSVIIGAFSVILCSFLYLNKRRRMTLAGMFIGFTVTVVSLFHLF
jgi:hypothetical protein